MTEAKLADQHAESVPGQYVDGDDTSDRPADHAQRSDLDRMLTILDAGQNEAFCRRMLVDLGADHDQQAQRTVGLLVQHLDGIAASLTDVCPEGDEYELPQALSNAWLELQFLWNRWNQQVQYQNMFRGAAQPGLMVVSALLGDILEKLKNFLDPVSLMMIHKMAADPHATAQRAALQTQRLFDRMTQAGQGGSRAIEVLLQAQDQFQRLRVGDQLQRELDQAVEQVIDEIDRSLVMTGEDLAPALEASFTAATADAPLRVVLVMHGFDPEVSLAPDLSHLLLDASREWLEAMVAQSMGTGADARMAQQRSAYVTVNAQLSRDADDILLVLRDDADGCTRFKRRRPSDVERNLRIAVEQQAGVGSSLELRCSQRKVNEYLLVRVRCSTSDEQIVSLPACSVQAIERRPVQDLFSGGRMLRGKCGSAPVDVVDVGGALFGVEGGNAGDTAVMVLVHRRCGRTSALLVSSVEGIHRSSVRAMPEGLPHRLMCGLIKAERNLVPVVNLEAL